MKKIYIVTTFTGTVASYLIKNIIKTPYVHVSISLNKYLNPMYSFGRLNYKTPIFGGFVEENINEGLYSIKTNTICRIYSLIITEKQYYKLKDNIDNISINRKKYVYDFKGIIYFYLNKPRKKDYKYVCSNFVADMMQRSDINILDKEAYKVRPNDFYNLDDLELEYEGLLSKYYEKNKIKNIAGVI